MQGTYYETDRLFGLIGMLILWAFLSYVFRCDRKQREMRARNRARHINAKDSEV